MYIIGSILGDSGSWASIFSILITGVLLYTTDNTRRKVQRLIKFKDFKLDKKSLINELQSSKELIINASPNDIDSLYNVSELAVIFRRLEDYKMYMEKTDKEALTKAKLILSRGIHVYNRSELIKHISTLIGFLQSRLEYDVKSI